MARAAVAGRRRVVDPKTWLETHAPELAHAGGRRSSSSGSACHAVSSPASAEPDTAAALDARFPDARREIVAAADALIEGRFDLLGYRESVVRRSHRLASRPGLVAARSARALEPARPARSGRRRRQQDRLGAQPASMARAARASVDGDRSIGATPWRASRRSTPGVTRIRRDIGINWTSSLEVSLPPDVVVLDGRCSFETPPCCRAGG